MNHNGGIPLRYERSKGYISLLLVLVLLMGALGAEAALPRKLVMLPAPDSMFIGETLTLTATPLPVGATGNIVWNSSNKRLATVDAQGVVTALAPGTVKITARVKNRTSVYVSKKLTLTVDPSTLTLRLTQAEPLLSPGEQVSILATIEPAGSGLKPTWHSSNERVATVDESGRVWARSAGMAMITASIAGGPSDTIAVTVRDTPRALEIPARTTDVHGIADNLAKIAAVKKSALAEVNALMMSGAIPAGDAQTRITTITRAFAMYAMPWMTETTQPYWVRSYGTRKDFFPGVVYYGLPYIQHGLRNNSVNRTYNEAKAIAQGFYINTGKGYYMLSPTKRRDGMYVGNDCSSFVGMSIWGAGKRNALLRSRRIYDSPLYKTVASYSAMRPGDILVKNGHVLFFLYFTNKEKTRMMILEQGGGTAIDLHNTVTCSIVETSAYLKGKYRARRLRSLK